MNYVAFLRESDPPPAVLAALAQIHSFLAQAAEQDGLSVTEALGAVLGVEGNGGVRGGCSHVPSTFMTTLDVLH